MIDGLHRLARATAALQRYRNPLHIFRKRMFGRATDKMTIVDRRTGVRCECPLAAFHMYASIWYEHDYDIPGMPIRSGDVVIDVGANYGFFSCYAASRGAKVYAFEPSPPVYEYLERNIRANHFESLITARPWALSDYSGEARFLRTERLGGAMSTIVPEFAERTGIPVVEQMTVRTHRLSEVLKEFALAKVRLCKIDAEGSEIAILKGIEQGQSQCLESVVLEYHPEAYPLRELLAVPLGWGTHQVSLMDEKPFSGNIVRAVATSALLSHE